VGGMCDTDFSGYPDCRRETVDAMAQTLTLGMATPFVIETPLMRLTKADTWRLAEEIVGTRFVELVVSDTHTCYLGQRSTFHEWDTAVALAQRARFAREDTATGRADMSYAVKELFHTLQGEGVNAGRAAVFCRFAGCNLWSGLESDRRTAVCKFCDTDFVGTDGTHGGRFASASALAAKVEELWPPRTDAGRFVVLTGGEPLLPVDSALIAALHGRGFRIAIETNGTIEAPPGLDWICVSPKAGTVLRGCNKTPSALRGCSQHAYTGVLQAVS
jgi:queuosine biosynthesis protein QueC